MNFGAKTVQSVVPGVVISSVQEKQDTVEVAIPDIFIMVQRVFVVQLCFMGNIAHLVL